MGQPGLAPGWARGRARGWAVHTLLTPLANLVDATNFLNPVARSRGYRCSQCDRNTQITQRLVTELSSADLARDYCLGLVKARTSNKGHIRMILLAAYRR